MLQGYLVGITGFGNRYLLPCIHVQEISIKREYLRLRILII
jgi:hypothetical protein